MELNNTARNRRVGYLGVAVATLLTPAGKLISSAVAAGVTVALITMNNPKVADVSKTRVPNPVASSELIEEYFANELVDTSELAIPVTGAEVLPTKNNSAGLQLTPMSTAIDIASNTANGPSGGGFLGIPAFGAGFGATNILPSDPQADCEQVLKKNASERTALEKASCELQIAQTEDIKEEIVQLMAAVILESGNPNGEDEQVVGKNGEDEQVADKGEDEQVVDKKDEDNPVKPKKQPEDQSNALPTRQVSSLTSDGLSTIAAIPEPSTIGLLLLGLFSLGWIYRRNTGA